MQTKILANIVLSEFLTFIYFSLLAISCISVPIIFLDFSFFLSIFKTFLDFNYRLFSSFIASQVSSFQLSSISLFFAIHLTFILLNYALSTVLIILYSIFPIYYQVAHALTSACTWLPDLWSLSTRRNTKTCILYFFPHSLLCKRYSYFFHLFIALTNYVFLSVSSCLSTFHIHTFHFTYTPFILSFLSSISSLHSTKANNVWLHAQMTLQGK